MNHKHRVTLHALFAHPIGSNIEPKAVRSVLEELGADISHSGQGHLLVKLDGHTHAFNDAGHDLSKEAVMDLRRFLEQAGIDPVRDYPL
jgi:hypothetical protein